MGEELDGGFTVYDLGVVNHTNNILNNCEIGSLYTWTQCSVTLNNTDIDVIYDNAVRRISNSYPYNADDGLIINGNSTVNKIVAVESTADTMFLYIEINDNAVVDTLEITDVDGEFKLENLKVGADATLKNVVYNGTAYTYANFVAAMTPVAP